jgi:hypothetical protein
MICSAPLSVIILLLYNRAELQQETALVRGQYVTSSDTVTSCNVHQYVASSLDSSVQTAYKATYSVLYAYSTLYTAKINVLSIPDLDKLWVC